MATQQSIKAYVDSQVTAQDLDFACDDSTTLSIDLDSESLQFSGGTGITTAGTLNTVTVAIDSTVATLDGSQTLTNKTLTGPIVSGGVFTGTTEIDNLNFNDNIISSDSNADISIQPGGTGSVIASGLSFSGTTISAPDSSTVNINEGLNVDGTVTVEGTTNTADVVTTGATTISGALTAGSLNIGDLNISADGSITSDTNGDIVIDPAGTGEIVLTGTVTHAGTQTTTGQLNVDNLRFDGNTFSATSGGITITPATGQNVAVGGTGTKLTATEAQFTLMEAGTVRADAIQNDTSDGDIAFSTQGTGVFDFNSAIKMGEISKPTAVADHGFIYVKDDSGAEVFVLDGADNETKISPHNDKGEWEYYSRNITTGKTVRINMEAMIRDLEKFTGNKYIQTV